MMNMSATRVKRKIGVSICDTDPVVSAAIDSIREGADIEATLALTVKALSTGLRVAQDELLKLRLSSPLI